MVIVKQWTDRETDNRSKQRMEVVIYSRTNIYRTHGFGFDVFSTCDSSNSRSEMTMKQYWGKNILK